MELLFSQPLRQKFTSQVSLCITLWVLNHAQRVGSRMQALNYSIPTDQCVLTG